MLELSLGTFGDYVSRLVLITHPVGSFPLNDKQELLPLKPRPVCSFVCPARPAEDVTSNVLN